ncbi:MAG: PDZ domain-containing protein [Desulfovibrionaceae bacterium]
MNLRQGIVALLTLFCCMSLTACATQRKAQPVPLGPEWPAQAIPGRVWLQPRLMASPEAARRALADLGPRLSVPGRQGSSVLPRFLRSDLLAFDLSWTQTEQREWRPAVEYRRPCWDVDCDEPNYLAVMVRVRKNATEVLPLDQMDGLRAQVRGNEQVVSIRHEKGRTTEMAVPDAQSRTLLVDALFTLAMAHGANPSEQEDLLFQDLTPEQARILGQPGGVLVLGTALGGPAEQAGLAYPDVILRLDNTPATAALLRSALKNAAPLHLAVLRWSPGQDGAGLTKEQRAAVLVPAPITLHP